MPPSVGRAARAPPVYARCVTASPIVRTPGVSASTWAIWAVALSPLLEVIGIAVLDVEGYFRATLDLALQGRSGSTDTTLPPGFFSAFGTFAIGGVLGFLAQVALVVFAAVDWSILRRRGVDRPFHWAWSFFVLVSLGQFVYPIGRTVVARDRTGRGGAAPLVVFIVLTVVAVAVAVVKFAAAFALVGDVASQVATSP